VDKVEVVPKPSTGLSAEKIFRRLRRVAWLQRREKLLDMRFPALLARAIVRQTARDHGPYLLHRSEKQKEEP
jgi:hypothetical protein